MKTKPIQIDEQLHKLLKIKAAEQGVSLNWLTEKHLREALLGPKAEEEEGK